jgi:hypothetical protein
MGRKNKKPFAASHQGGLGSRANASASPPQTEPQPQQLRSMPPPRDSIVLIRLRGAMEAIESHKSNMFLKAAEEAPFTIRSLGLGTSIQAMLSKGNERAEFAELLARWLLRDCPHSPLGHNADASAKNVLTVLGTKDRNTYRAAQTEALGYASTLKRLAQAFCPDKPAEGGSDGDA